MVDQTILFDPNQKINNNYDCRLEFQQLKNYYNFRLYFKKKFKEVNNNNYQYEKDQYYLIEKDWLQIWKKHVGYDDICRYRYTIHSHDKELNDNDYSNILSILAINCNRNTIFPLENNKIYGKGELNPLSDYVIVDKKCYDSFISQNQKSNEKNKTYPIMFLKGNILLRFSSTQFLFTFKVIGEDINKSPVSSYWDLIFVLNENFNETNLINQLCGIGNIPDWLNKCEFDLNTDKEKEFNLYEGKFKIYNKTLIINATKNMTNTLQPQLNNGLKANNVVNNIIKEEMLEMKEKQTEIQNKKIIFYNKEVSEFDETLKNVYYNIQNDNMNNANKMNNMNNNPNNMNNANNMNNMNNNPNNMNNNPNNMNNMNNANNMNNNPNNMNNNPNNMNNMNYMNNMNNNPNNMNNMNYMNNMNNNPNNMINMNNMNNPNNINNPNNMNNMNNSNNMNNMNNTKLIYNMSNMQMMNNMNNMPMMNNMQMMNNMNNMNVMQMMNMNSWKSMNNMNNMQMMNNINNTNKMNNMNMNSWKSMNNMNNKQMVNNMQRMENINNTNNMNSMNNMHNMNNININNINNQNNMYNQNNPSNNINNKKNYENPKIIGQDHTPIYPHKTGLENIGQTCYMNSTIQCLSNIKYLSEVLIRNFGNFNVEKQPLTLAFSSLVFDLFTTKKKDIAPKLFKNIIGKLNPLFEGMHAADAKDLIFFLLETMHLELNTKKDNLKETQIDYIQLEKDSFDKDKMYKNFIKDYKEKNNSIISETFYGITLSTMTCKNCQKTKYSFQTFNLLIFQLKNVKEYNKKTVKNNDDYVINIYDAFDCDKKEEILDGENMIYCNFCKKLNPGIHQQTIYSLPKVLIIILNRGRNNLDFNEEFIFPKELNLSIENYVIKNEKHTNFYLQSVITHLGESGSGGHFIAYCRNGPQGEFLCYNDSIVSKATEKDAMGSKVSENVYEKRTPYILVYHHLN